MYSGKIAVPPGGGGMVTKVTKYFNLQLTLTGVGEYGRKSIKKADKKKESVFPVMLLLSAQVSFLWGVSCATPCIG
jgi:hypothetical protein